MADVYDRTLKLAATHSNAAIAVLTGLSESTVSRHVRGQTRYPGRPGAPRSNPVAYERGRGLWKGGMPASRLVEMLSPSPVSRRTVYRWIQQWIADAE